MATEGFVSVTNRLRRVATFACAASLLVYLFGSDFARYTVAGLAYHAKLPSMWSHGPFFAGDVRWSNIVVVIAFTALCVLGGVAAGCGSRRVNPK